MFAAVCYLTDSRNLARNFKENDMSVTSKVDEAVAAVDGGVGQEPAKAVRKTPAKKAAKKVAKKPAAKKATKKAAAKKTKKA